MKLPDDIAPINAMHTFLAGIRQHDNYSYKEDTDDETLGTAVHALNSITSVTWDRVRQATARDDTMNLLLSTIESGIPKHRHELHPTIREYHQFREHLYMIDGVVIYKDRVVIPPTLRNEVLSALHAAHQGVSSMTARAESSVFWPGISPAIASTRATCNHCNRIAPSQTECPTNTNNTADIPFPVYMCQLLHRQRHIIPLHSRPILQLANYREDNRRCQRFDRQS